MGALIAAGANVIGGCCGTGPAHISAMVSVVGRRRY
jgi:methionine synthase I (cobalamin-dependent)